MKGDAGHAETHARRQASHREVVCLYQRSLSGVGIQVQVSFEVKA